MKVKKGDKVIITKGFVDFLNDNLKLHCDTLGKYISKKKVEEHPATIEFKNRCDLFKKKVADFEVGTITKIDKKNYNIDDTHADIIFDDGVECSVSLKHIMKNK